MPDHHWMVWRVVERRGMALTEVRRWGLPDLVVANARLDVEDAMARDDAERRSMEASR